MNPAIGLFAPSGRVDNSSAGACEREVAGLLESGKASLVIDLSQVDYLSSAGLRVLLVAAKGCKARGGSAILVGPQGPVLEVLKMSGFDRLLNIAHDREAAVAALGIKP